MNGMTTDGLTLRLQRVARDVKQTDLAARMGVTNSTVSRLEASRIVRPEMAQRYLEALATFGTVVTDASPPASAA